MQRAWECCYSSIKMITSAASELYNPTCITLRQRCNIFNRELGVGQWLLVMGFICVGAQDPDDGSMALSLAIHKYPTFWGPEGGPCGTAPVAWMPVAIRRRIRP